MTFDPPLADDVGRARSASLVAQLRAAGLDVVPTATDGAVAVDVTVALSVDAARTDTGSVYHAAHGRATVRALRARVDVLGRPGVARTAGEALDTAWDRLAERVTAAVAE